MGRTKKFIGRFFRPKNLIKTAATIAAAAALPAVGGAIASGIGQTAARFGLATARAAAPARNLSLLSRTQAAFGRIKGIKLSTSLSGPVGLGTGTSQAIAKSKFARVFGFIGRHPFLVAGGGIAAVTGTKFLLRKKIAQAEGEAFARGVSERATVFGGDGASLPMPRRMARGLKRTRTRGEKMGLLRHLRHSRFRGGGFGEAMIARPRRRGAGVSARDIRGASKVARLVKRFGFKPKFSPRKHKRA